MTRPLDRIARVQDLAEQAARAERPAVTFRELDAASRTPPPCPGFLFGPANEAVARQMYAQTMVRATGCYALRDAAIGPTGIAMQDKLAYCSDSLNHHRPYLQTTVHWLNQQTLPVREVAGPLVGMFGPSHEVFGHFIVDYLPRLWLLQACGYALDTLRFVVPAQAPPWSLDLLAAIGLRPDQLERHSAREEVLRTDLFIVPTILRTYERLSPSFAPATRFWVERVRARLAPASPPAEPGPERVFVSRQRLSAGRVLTNRDAIEAIAARRGTVIVHPETATLAEQVALFGGVRQIVGEYGSGLHNAVFSGPGTYTCALRGTLRDPGCIQSGIAQALNQQVGYVFGRTVGTDRDQRVTIDENDFRRALEVMALH